MILLDTHVVVWMNADSARLSRSAKNAIAAAAPGAIFISDITLWEIANLAHRGKIEMSGGIQRMLQEICKTVVIKPITATIASMTAEFPSGYPKDPADRIIGATSRAEGLPLVTADRALRRSSLLQTIW